jgi:hypothetical protein
MRSCIGVELDTLAKLPKEKKTFAMQQLQKVVQAMEAGLSYQYNKNWDLVFQVLASAVQVTGKIFPAIWEKVGVNTVQLYVFSFLFVTAIMIFC